MQRNLEICRFQDFCRFQDRVETAASGHTTMPERHSRLTSTVQSRSRASRVHRSWFWPPFSEPIWFLQISSLKSDFCRFQVEFRVGGEFHTKGSRNMMSEHNRNVAAGTRPLIFDANFILGENGRFCRFQVYQT